MAVSPSPTSDDQFAIGSVLDDRYRIDAVLGTGGMGRVYRAEHTKIGKSVAIKVLHADLNRNREASQRFQREAIASGRLDHPNIVGVSDFGVLDDGACYLVMEVLEGESLGDRLARDHRIHWVEALDILRGVLYGLRHAHERGVVHRDIKPDNIYLAHKDGDPVIKILDFGIAKLYAGSADDPASTRAGLTVGTPAYLSPEQAVGGEITPASDLYSASIVLYEMLAGRAPFEDKDPLAMLGAHVSRRPPAFADVAPGVDIPAPLEDIIQRGLIKAAAERISTAGDYLAMIDAFSPPLHAMPRLGTAPVMDAVAMTSMPTPVPGMPTPVPGMPTPVPGMPTPVPGMPWTQTTGPTTTGSLPAAADVPGSVELSPRPRAIRAVSLADVSEPIPLTWIVRSGVVIGLVIVGAIVLAIATHCGGSEPARSSPPSTKPSARPPPASTPSPKPAPASTPSPKPAPTPTPKSAPASTLSPKSSAVQAPASTPSPKSSAVQAPASTPSPKPALASTPSPKPAPTPTPTPKSAPASTPGSKLSAAQPPPSAPLPTPPPPGPVPAAGTTKPAAGTTKPAAGTTKPAAGTTKPAAGTTKPATGATKPADHEAQLTALVHDLELGKTCTERKAAIAKLVELHDAHVVPALRRARLRAGGAPSNDNGCLKADAEHAIKELGGTLK